MADAPVVHIGENSPEQVALKLLAAIAAVEKKLVPGIGGSNEVADRAWILDTYAECLHATRGLRPFKK